MGRVLALFATRYEARREKVGDIKVWCIYSVSLRNTLKPFGGSWERFEESHLNRAEVDQRLEVLNNAML